jgi:signal transduction histidine kinase
MPLRKLNCWEELCCGREPGGPHEHELGPCPATTDTTCDGINDGRNAGRLCWAITGTLCGGEPDGAFAEKRPRCEHCSFFRRVKYEEGCRFQVLRPGLETADPNELHRLLNNIVKLIGVCADIFACLAEGPLLKRIVRHALAITHSSSASAYVFTDAGEEIVLEAHAGPLARPQRISVHEHCPVAAAARAKRLCKGRAAAAGQGGPASVAAIPIGGLDRLAGVLELVKSAEEFSVDDEWFLGQFSLIAGLGIENAKLIEDLRQLKRFDKAKSRFVALLMHHIASPLATIACSLQALAQLGEKLKDDDREKLIQFSLERINSIQTLSKRLLDLAAIRSGSSLAQVRPVCPAEALRLEVEGRLARAQEEGVELLAPKLDSTPPVLADPDGLRVIFANLLGNAIKYCTGPVKKVEGSLRVERGHVRVCIRDTGIGIPPDEQRRIFEEFQRGSNVAKATGFGIGLAVVKELVDRYGGQIELESTVGVGTTVSVLFPIAGEDEVPADEA